MVLMSINLPLTDPGAGEVIEAADQAVLSQKGEAQVLLDLDVVSGPVESLADDILFRSWKTGIQRGRTRDRCWWFA